MLGKFPARDSQLYPIGAYANQGGETYQGSDQWSYKILPEGTLLAQLDYLPNRGDLTETASQFFTNANELERHRDSHTGKINTRTLSERLQVMAHRFNPDSAYNYSEFVSVYEVVSPMPVAFAKVSDNIAFGEGGADQFYSVDEKNNLIHRKPELVGGATSDKSIGYLRLVEQVQSSERKPNLDVYKDIERNNLRNFSQITSAIGKQHNAYKTALALSGDKSALNVMLAMRERESFSKSVFQRFETRDWAAIKDTILLDTLPNRLDLDGGLKTLVENIKTTLLNSDNALAEPLAQNSNLDLYQGELVTDANYLIAPVKNLRVRNAAEIDIGIAHEPSFKEKSALLKNHIEAAYSPKENFDKTLKTLLAPHTSMKDMEAHFNSNAIGAVKPVKKGLIGRVDEAATKRACVRARETAKDLKKYFNARRLKHGQREQDIKKIVEMGLPKPSKALAQAYDNARQGRDIMSGIASPISLKGLIAENQKLGEILDSRRDIFGANDVAAKRVGPQISNIRARSTELSKALTASKTVSLKPGLTL